MLYPIVIYDNLCTSCTSYAKFANRLLGGKVTMVGHYSTQGMKLKESIFPKDYEGLDMSWFVTEKRAYGGREGLKQLVKYLLTTLFNKNYKEFPKNNFSFNECSTDCRTIKGTMIRSCSILTNSKIIEIN